MIRIKYIVRCLGGLEAVCNRIISFDMQHINWNDTLPQSPVLQEVMAPQISMVNKKMSDKDRVKRDGEGVALENYAPYGESESI